MTHEITRFANAVNKNMWSELRVYAILATADSLSIMCCRLERDGSEWRAKISMPGVWFPKFGECDTVARPAFSRLLCVDCRL